MKKEKKQATETVQEVETKKPKKVSKTVRKDAKRQKELALANEKKKISEKITSLKKEKKGLKDKAKKKEIKHEIRSLKKERNEIGKKDTYLRDVKKEMKMVRWPSTKEVVKYSIASLVFVAFFAVFYYGIDAIFALVKDLVS